MHTHLYPIAGASGAPVIQVSLAPCTRRCRSRDGVGHRRGASHDMLRRSWTIVRRSHAGGLRVGRPFLGEGSRTVGPHASGWRSFSLGCVPPANGCDTLCTTPPSTCLTTQRLIGGWGGLGGGLIQHSPGTPTTGLRELGNDTSKSTGHSGRQKAATRRNIRREERVTVQGPVKEQQRDGMSHGGAGGGGGYPPPHRTRIS